LGELVQKKDIPIPGEWSDCSILGRQCGCEKVEENNQKFCPASDSLENRLAALSEMSISCSMIDV
jgi:hypothetical protein